MTNEPIVTFRFDAIGAKRFAEITRENVGRPFAIVLDGKVLSAPVIREPITGGSGQISGNFTAEETVQLAALLSAGALPVPLKVIEERTVGADLGSDAIRMGAVTGLAGFVLVCGFMMVLYGRWGLVANLALGLNVVLTFAALTLLGATLTLPGIAGIVLGIGLAVDANVLINERIREETREGRSARGGARCRLQPRLCDHRRLQRDGADRDRAVVLVRLRAGARLCRDHGARHRDLDVHRRFGGEGDHGDVGPSPAAEGLCDRAAVPGASSSGRAATSPS